MVVRTLATAGLALFVLNALGCTAGCPGEGDDHEPLTLVLGTTQEPSTLDPAFAMRSGEQEVVRLLFPDLTVFNDEGEVVPRLAAELPMVTTSTRGPIVRWRLRTGLAWSDGAPLTSADVVFAHTIEANEQLAAVNHAVAKQVESIAAIDAQAFEVRWQTKYRGVTDPRVHAVLPQHRYPRPEGPSFSGLGRDPHASSGPYRLVEWRSGQQLSLEANPFWPGPVPPIERIVFRFFPSDDAFETELRTGGIDALGPASGLGVAHAQRLARALGASHELVSSPSGLLLQLSLRLEHPLLSKPEVRRALSLAIDRHRMADLVYGGQARAAFGIYGPAHPAHRARATLPFDPTRAKAILKAQTDNRPLTLVFAAGSEASERAAVYLHSALKEAGFQVVLRAMPLRVLLGQLKGPGQAPLTLFAWRTRPDWAGSSMFRTGGRLNYFGYSSSPVDELLTSEESTFERARWVSILHQIEANIMEDLPLIPLLFRNEVSLKPSGLRGWRPTGTTTPVTWNAETWHWAPQAP